VPTTDSSLLSTHLWDVRASLEAQVRCLTTIQKNVTDFQKTPNEKERASLKGKILSDLAQIGQLSLTVIQTLQPTIEQAGIELQVA
jgi:hypothetical protein